ncbi:hypothetical protein LDO32_16105 [Luteimonas sp. Y-2-2-4F]|nr:Rap1a/Tai family immunity protein [Luteimonas sp. Y-2-2-4F]MCD9033249.1 hypothetical protein [Luteimonas sp. Y-2-2-4F]
MPASRHPQRPMLAAALACALPFCAFAQGRDWIVSGAELARALEGDAAPEATDPELRRRLSRERGQSCLQGVADLTRGARWCGRIKPHELADRVYAYLGDLPPARLQDNAATLVAEALSAHFPCAAAPR